MKKDENAFGDVTIVINPDQDMNHPTEKVPRVSGGLQLSTETMRLSPSPRPGGVAEDTELFVITPHSVRTELIAPTCSRLVVGSSPYADLPISNANVDSKHLAIIRTEQGWLFAERGKTDRCTFDGIRGVQSVTPAVSRTIIGLGDGWIVFFGACATASHVRLKQPPVRDAVAGGAHVEASAGATASAGSWGSPILIGTHPRADLILPKSRKGAASFHGAVIWTCDGICYQPFTAATPAFPVTPDDTGACEITDRGIPIRIQFVGDVAKRERQLATKRNQEWNRFTFVGLGSTDPSIIMDRTGAALTLGRGACDVQLRETSISRVHAHLQPRNKHVRIIDKSSRNGSFINGSPVKKTLGTKAFPGDVIGFGKLRYRLEYAR